VAALRNGTLVDATVIPDDLGDMLATTYEGGTPRRGLRDISIRIAGYAPAMEAIEQSRAALSAQKTRLIRRSSELTAKAAKTREEAQSQIAEAASILDATRSLLDASNEASETAIAAFGKAERFAKAAALAATTWAGKASRAPAEAKGSEAERLRMITSDGDMQASMQCLTGRAAYETALTLARQLDTARVVSDSAEAIVTVTGSDVSLDASGDLDDYRNRAIDRLEVAALSYTAAGRSIAKTSAGSIQGKHYAWQAQVGEAAVHLLHGAVVSDEDVARIHRTSAYDLLTEAAKDREQSPLLQPAIQTLLFLQAQAARE